VILAQSYCPLREILDDAIDDLDPSRNQLRGRCLEHSRDLLIRGATFISLYNNAADVYSLRKGVAEQNSILQNRS